MLAWSNIGWPLPRRLSALLLALSALSVLWLGLRIAGDYPVPMDEPTMLELGSETYSYALGRAPWPTNLNRRYQGPVTEWFLYAVQRAKYGPVAVMTAEHVVLRHRLIFLLSFSGVVFMGFLATRITGRWRYGVLAAVMFLATPRLFAHAFMNSKDLPNVSYVVLSMLALWWLLERPNARRAALFGSAAGLAIASRIFNVFIPVLGVGLLLLECWFARNDQATRFRSGSAIAVSLLSTAATTYALWPFLWEAPLQHFLEGVRYATRFQSDVWYLGERITEPAWHYHLVWMLVTIPLAWTVLAITGSVHAIQHWLRQRRWPQARLLLFLGLWLFLPLVAAATAQSTDFNDWRHFLFVYPPVVLLAVLGLQAMVERLPRWRVPVCAAVAISLLSTVFWMVRYHPLQSAYFAFPGRWFQGVLEIDYWALSTRSLLQALAAIDDRPTLRLHAPGITHINAFVFLPPGKFVVSDADTADYIIDHFPGSGYRPSLPQDRLVVSIVVDGAVLSSAYRGPVTVLQPAPASLEP